MGEIILQEKCKTRLVPICGGGPVYPAKYLMPLIPTMDTVATQGPCTRER
jgi:hypothetical protein